MVFVFSVTFITAVNDEVEIPDFDFFPDCPDLFLLNPAPTRNPPKSLKHRTVLGNKKNVVIRSASKKILLKNFLSNSEKCF